jgi:hypothetical protein
MTTITMASARFRTSMCGGASFVRTVSPAVGFVPSHAAAVTIYRTLTNARKDAQGGADAWSPPV